MKKLLVVLCLVLAWSLLTGMTATEQRIIESRIKSEVQTAGYSVFKVNIVQNNNGSDDWCAIVFLNLFSDDELITANEISTGPKPERTEQRAVGKIIEAISSALRNDSRVSMFSIMCTRIGYRWVGKTAPLQTVIDSYDDVFQRVNYLLEADKLVHQESDDACTLQLEQSLEKAFKDREKNKAKKNKQKSL